MLMRHLIVFALILLSVALFSCEVKMKTKDDKQAPEKEKKEKTGNYLNGIVINNGGINVVQAGLTDESGLPLDETNTVGLGENVILRLVIDGGYEVKSGKVEIGASEKIETSAGQTVLNEDDLFSTTGPVSATDAKLITLKAVITKTSPEIEFFRVSFRVWDKNNKNEASGYYRFKVK